MSRPSRTTARGGQHGAPAHRRVEGLLRRPAALPASRPLQHFRWSGSTMLQYRRPCVYVWWRAARCEYVGSGVSLGRVVDPGHHRLRFRRADVVEILWFDTLAEARAFEVYLIRVLRPRLNGTPVAERSTNPVSSPGSSSREGR